ncbi:E3 ubiquitin/ISG15 ligase TRIM25-like [Clarias gariepinus]|uniref:tripartite motif-containing protein 16-like n=1 Tax=Clarias gariepinus TaxID=13013 RepID=UPI00234C82FB|nr:tripartite motif-containing protein 16-like [Clarias gariepinus]
MAEASISVDQDQFICAVCLDLLKDPVTLPCGHSFCKVCINGCWDQEDHISASRCPQCRDIFTTRPDLRRNNMLAEVVEKLKKKTKVQAASPAHCYAEPGDVECDFCVGRKRKAPKSCLTCLASLCETHLKPHLEVPALKKHRLVEASEKLEEEICSEHHKLIEIYCRTDQSGICSLCMLDKHKGHDAVVAERAKKQLSAQTAVASRAGRLMEQLEDELFHLPQAFASEQRSLTSERPDSRISSISVHQYLSFDGVVNSFSDLKKRLEKYVEEVQIFLSEPRSRDEFLKYFCYLTLDPNTTHQEFILSENNRVVKYSEREQQYPDHPDRFDFWPHVLSKESVSGRCYWEVEWESDIGVAIAVVYKGIGRKGPAEEYKFSSNNQSWSLEFPSASSSCFYHNSIKTDLSAPSSSRIGVYVDHSAGTLSFYSVSDTMTLLHRVRTTFTQPLYAGFAFYNCGGSESGRIIRLCDQQWST